MTIRNVENITGKKLSFRERISFRFFQNELKRQIKKGTIDGSEKVDFQKFYESKKEKFVFGAFLLGFLFGLIGVLIIAVTSKKKEDIRSAWFGVLAALMFVLILFIFKVPFPGLLGDFTM